MQGSLTRLRNGSDAGPEVERLETIGLNRHVPNFVWVPTNVQSLAGVTERAQDMPEFLSC